MQNKLNNKIKINARRNSFDNFKKKILNKKDQYCKNSTNNIQDQNIETNKRSEQMRAFEDFEDSTDNFNKK